MTDKYNAMRAGYGSGIQDRLTPLGVSSQTGYPSGINPYHYESSLPEFQYANNQGIPIGFPLAVAGTAGYYAGENGLIGKGIDAIKEGWSSLKNDTMDYFRNPVPIDRREESIAGRNTSIYDFPSQGNIHENWGINPATAPLYGPHDPFAHQTEAEMARIASLNYGGDDRDLVNHTKTIGEILEEKRVEKEIAAFEAELEAENRAKEKELTSPLGGIPRHFL